MKLLVSFLSLLAVASAHFKLDYPAARGFDEDKLPTFPCGGQNAVSSNRTAWPLKGGAVQLEMEHDRVMVQILLGLGNDVGDSFNITLLPIIEQEGEGSFCLKDIALPDGTTVTDGQNATIQVVTNGDPTGGLYNCADITFSADAPAAPSCQNGTGMMTMPYTGPFKNANQSDPTSGSAATSASAAASPTNTGAAAALGRGVEWSAGMVVMGAVGFAVLL
ncbi:MAG: hypothetical protein M4579_006761 [Chaenotheca gracillima]|nr:MAG: hypothetical protein M4579_006761 [Chaenotheca gracillima]